MTKNINISGVTHLKPFSEENVRKFSPLTSEEMEKVLKSIDESLKIMDENSHIPVGKTGVTELNK